MINIIVKDTPSQAQGKSSEVVTTFKVAAISWIHMLREDMWIQEQPTYL